MSMVRICSLVLCRLCRLWQWLCACVRVCGPHTTLYTTLHYTTLHYTVHTTRMIYDDRTQHQTGPDQTGPDCWARMCTCLCVDDVYLSLSLSYYPCLAIVRTYRTQGGSNMFTTPEAGAWDGTGFLMGPIHPRDKHLVGRRMVRSHAILRIA